MNEATAVFTWFRLLDRRGEVRYGSRQCIGPASEWLQDFANISFIIANIIRRLREDGRVVDGELDGFAAGRTDAASKATDSGRQCPRTAHGIVQRLSPTAHLG